MDHTGTGNTLDTSHPTTLRLILDSLRYWAGEMHVDGFRFDLASALARGDHGFDPHCAFLSAVGQDPMLAQVKLIAEPWDATAAGYQVGRFPAGWSEWNDCFRNGVRDFWRGRAWSPAEMGFRLTGSSDLYQRDHRRPQASVNFVTAHDGFTLRDLVSYDRKHNRANGEDGRDGSDDNRSWNCGAEGETADPAIGELRRRQQRNFLATLLLSQGVPMLLAGDEMNRTQRGNNNAYCHDGPLGWVDWDLDEAASELCELTRALVYLRRHSTLLRREQFLNGGSRPAGAPPGSSTDLPDVAWLTPEGTPMGEREWSAPGSTAFTMVLNGPDETLAVLFNAANGPVKMVLPGRTGAGSDAVEILVDTAGRLDGTVHGGGGLVELESRSLVVGRVRPRPG